MNTSKRNFNMLAVDIGAGSGRLVLGKYSAGELSLTEVERFEHRDCLINGILYWDFQDIFNKVKDGIRKAIASVEHLDSIGFDSFAPDFVCFSELGQPVGNMLSYRNFQHETVLKDVLSVVSSKSFTEICGNKPLSFSLLSQLVFIQKSGLLPSNTKIIPMPLANALGYLFSGRFHTDRTQSSISMLSDRHGNWSKALVDHFIQPPLQLPEIMPCGEMLGQLVLDGTVTDTTVINVGSHDTACANGLLAASASEELLINSGTWISVGTATNAPITTDCICRSGLYNYGLPDGGNLLCRLSYGMGLIRTLRSRMYIYDYEANYALLGMLADSSTYDQYFSVYEPDLFTSEHPIEVTIQSILRQRGKPAPECFADIVRCVYTSLTENIAGCILDLQKATGRHFVSAYLGGGGVQDQYFVRRIEERTGLSVISMPIESTAIGNIRMQLHAFGVNSEALEIIS